MGGRKTHELHFKLQQGSVHPSGTVTRLSYKCFCPARPAWRWPAVEQEWDGARAGFDKTVPFERERVSVSY